MSTNYSRQININVLAAARSNQGWNTNVQSSAAYFGGQKQSSGAQNDEIVFDFMADPGTYALDLFHVTGTNRGIYSIYIDDVVSLSVVDGYDAGGVLPRHTPVTGLLVVTNGQHTIKLKMETRNASNVATPGFYGVISGLVLTRTA